MTGLAGAHHIDTDYIMSNALYEYPPEHFSAVLGRVQQYLTIHIFQIEELDEEVCGRVVHLAPMAACWGYAGAQPPAQYELDCAQCLLACRPVLRLVQPMVCTRSAASALSLSPGTVLQLSNHKAIDLAACSAKRWPRCSRSCSRSTRCRARCPSRSFTMVLVSPCCGAVSWSGLVTCALLCAVQLCNAVLLRADPGMLRMGRHI